MAPHDNLRASGRACAERSAGPAALEPCICRSALSTTSRRFHWTASRSLVSFRRSFSASGAPSAAPPAEPPPAAPPKEDDAYSYSYSYGSYYSSDEGEEDDEAGGAIAGLAAAATGAWPRPLGAPATAPLELEEDDPELAELDAIYDYYSDED